MPLPISRDIHWFDLVLNKKWPFEGSSRVREHGIMIMGDREDELLNSPEKEKQPIANEKVNDLADAVNLFKTVINNQFDSLSRKLEEQQEVNALSLKAKAGVC